MTDGLRVKRPRAAPPSFLPATGVLVRALLPAGGPRVRYDTGAALFGNARVHDEALDALRAG
ncbi:hypothetical protein CQJ94_08665 [Glycomyces fuscus]|nr:hypothetical protein CQJ94_08665 [Glycomyces fuscus]